jgi:hypothetical protein
MKNIIVPSLLAAIAVFIWMFISWSQIGWHNIDIENLPDETVVDQMKQSVTESGIYLYPGQPTDESDSGMTAWTERHKAGPNIHFMVYSPAGADPMEPMQFIKSFIINFIAAFIAGVLLMMTLAQNPSFWRRVIFVMMLGLFAAFVGPFIEWNWWSFPVGYSMVVAADLCVTWFIAGLVLAWRIKPDLKAA